MKENKEATGVQRCGMDGEKVYHSAEEIDENAGYYSLFIVRDKE